MMSSMDSKTKALSEEIKSLIDSNGHVTKELESKKELLLEKRSEFQSLCQCSRDKVEDLKAAEISMTSLCDNLSIASHENELESDKFAEAFLAGDMPMDNFLTNYINSRKNYHLRKSKLEKFGTLTNK